MPERDGKRRDLHNRFPATVIIDSMEIRLINKNYLLYYKCTYNVWSCTHYKTTFTSICVYQKEIDIQETYIDIEIHNNENNERIITTTKLYKN